MQVLKQSTTATILVGPVLDADGAAYTSAVIGDFNITKNGSTAALAAAATATHSHNGMYLIALTTGNTDTLGRLDVSMNNTSYGMTNHRYEVLTANQFDALVTNGSVTPAAVADAVWDEAYSQHTTAGTFGKLMDILRKSNLTIEGTVSNAITPTTLTFSSNVSATTSAYAHAVLLFVSGPLTGENSPIISYNNTNGVFVLEEPLTAAPSNGDEFVVIAGSHVHAIADIQSGLATSAQATAIEADTQDIQGRLPAALVGGRMDSSVGAMATNTITASAVASDAVTEIQSGLATSSGVTAAFTEIKGAGWSSATDTLEQIRDASGSGGDTIMVTPVVAQTPVRVVGTNIETFIGDLSDIRVGVFSGEDPVDLSGFGDLEICVQTKGGVDLDFVEMADITIDGDDNNYFSWAPSGPSVAQVRSGAKWSLRKSSNKQVIAYGAWIVVDAALEDVGS